MATEVLPARRGRAFRVPRGTRIEIVNTYGSQVVDLWALALPELDEHLSTAHTRATLGSLSIAVGDALASDRRRPIATLVEDTGPGVHDGLFPACDPQRYAELGYRGHHDNCRDNFHAALAELGLERQAVPSPLNLFMNVACEGGRLELRSSIGRPGDRVTLRAELDLLVVLSACPQDMIPINGPAMEPADVEVEVQG